MTLSHPAVIECLNTFYIAGMKGGKNDNHPPIQEGIHFALGSLPQIANSCDALVEIYFPFYSGYHSVSVRQEVNT